MNDRSGSPLAKLEDLQMAGITVHQLAHARTYCSIVRSGASPTESTNIQASSGSHLVAALLGSFFGGPPYHETNVHVVAGTFAHCVLSEW